MRSVRAVKFLLAAQWVRGHILTLDTPPHYGGSSRHNHPKCSTRQFRRQGWKAIRIWQHSLKKSPATWLTRLRRALTKVRSSNC
jgi:very-short-patch-repair endonuclease